MSDSRLKIFSGNSNRPLAEEICRSIGVPLGEATVTTTSPLLMKEPDRAIFAKVEAQARLSRYGGDCYGYCMLAAGHVDLVIETKSEEHTSELQSH